jgi:small conductance mechanosensitive channel
MMEPLEIVGIDRFTDSAVVIRARIKTRPLRQWTVGREFNRRLKQAFDHNGIEMPAANQTRYLPELSRQPDGSAGAEPPQAAEPARPAAR